MEFLNGTSNPYTEYIQYAGYINPRKLARKGGKEALGFIEDVVKRKGKKAEKAVVESAGKVYNPSNPHPTMSEPVQNSFSGGTFTEKVLTQDTTFYRVYGGDAGKVGSYMTRTPQNGGLQSQTDLALNPAWGNTTTSVTKVVVPKGTVIYEGTAAPQNISGGGTLLGGGNQVYIPKVDASWFGK